MYSIPFQTIDWDNIPTTQHNGTTGVAYWQTILLDGLRIRKVIYSDNYKADHWCQKGHIVHCLEGEFSNELENGDIYKLTQGMTYVVSDDLSSHRSITTNKATLLIIDGTFLEPKEQEVSI
jgi:hypothetical protein